MGFFLGGLFIFCELLFWFCLSILYNLCLISMYKIKDLHTYSWDISLNLLWFVLEQYLLMLIINVWNNLFCCAKYILHCIIALGYGKKNLLRITGDIQASRRGFGHPLAYISNVYPRNFRGYRFQFMWSFVHITINFHRHMRPTFYQKRRFMYEVPLLVWSACYPKWWNTLMFAISMAVMSYSCTVCNAQIKCQLVFISISKWV